ncbi:hypothetical protein MKZ38_000665 [Zalerion maritima]|uniref:Uncharacterized protein n=1 Tax=Zalerion maritima TaxID=339359 RepID=A0AAD5RR82_9PEZI|nr:hypothetical protein MKZ38_000665 [Zalerion maritima]
MPTPLLPTYQTTTMQALQLGQWINIDSTFPRGILATLSQAKMAKTVDDTILHTQVSKYNTAQVLDTWGTQPETEELESLRV